MIYVCWMVALAALIVASAAIGLYAATRKQLKMMNDMLIAMVNHELDKLGAEDRALQDLFELIHEEEKNDAEA